MEIRLRIAGPEDADFAFQVERETMEAHAIATWGLWHVEETRARSLARIVGGLLQILEVDGARAGVLCVERTAKAIDVVQIYIAPKFQRRGVGGYIMRELMKEADASGVPLMLRVLRVKSSSPFP